MTFIYQTVSQCIAAIQIEQYSSFDFIGTINRQRVEDWFTSTFYKIFSNLYPNINFQSRQFAKHDIMINKQWSLVMSQNRKFKNDKRVGIFSNLQLCI